MLIRVQFLKGDKPSGRAYTYHSGVPVNVGDMVQINSSAKGVVTEIDVPEEEVAAFPDKVKSIVGKLPVVATFKNWSVYSVLKNEFQMPELGAKYLQGNVYGNPRFPDGSFIHSSPIDDILDCGDHKEIVTRTGSRYLIYPEDVNPEAEKAYPRYYDRLIVNVKMEEKSWQ